MQLPRPAQISADPGVNQSAMQWANLFLTALEQLLNGNLTGANVLDGSIKDADLVGSAGVLADMPPGREVAYSEFTSNVTVSATTEATATTVVTASAYTFDGATSVLIEMFVPRHITSATAGDNCTYVLYDGANSIGLLTIVTSPSTSGWGGPVCLSRKLVPSAGSHTYSLRAFRVTANATAGAGAGGTAALLPGYIRITKA